MANLNDIIPLRHTLRYPYAHTTYFIKLDDRPTVLHAAKCMDAERFHLERDLNRLRAENYHLRRMSIVDIPDEFLYPLDAERYTEEQLEEMDLESLKDLALSLYMRNRQSTQSWYRLTTENSILKTRILILRAEAAQRQQNPSQTSQ